MEPNAQTPTSTSPAIRAGMLPGVSVDERVENWFTYHPPTPEQVEHYEALRKGARAFAALIYMHTPPCPDQSAAVRKVREAVMTANAAIACRGF